MALTNITLRLDDQTLARLDLVSENEGRTRAQTARLAVKRYVDAAEMPGQTIEDAPKRKR
jgi:predicted transcriptional regulator